MEEINRKQIGRIGLSMAINYFTMQGYTISIPINDTQWYDLVVEKDNKFYTVQCKATNTSKDIVELRSTGGTDGGVYDTIFNHPELDYLFCVNKDFNMWLIPMKDLPQCRQITLRTEPAKNNQGFPTFKYRVQLSEVSP